MCPNGARQNNSLDVASDAAQIVAAVAMADTDDVLFDDRSFIEFGSHIVSRGSDQLDSPLVSLLIGAPPFKGGEKSVVDVDRWAANCVKKLFREDSHIASKNDQVHLPNQ